MMGQKVPKGRWRSLVLLFGIPDNAGVASAVPEMGAGEVDAAILRLRTMPERA